MSVLLALFWFYKLINVDQSCKCLIVKQPCVCFGSFPSEGLCLVSVHSEGVNPNSMEGVPDLNDHIGVEF